MKAAECSCVHDDEQCLTYPCKITIVGVALVADKLLNTIQGADYDL